MATTIKEVAELAGTSAAAVSATLNGTRSKNIRVGARTRERIYAAAAQLGYLPNPVARSLATGKSRVLGLMLPYVEAFTDHNPFCAQVTNGVLDEMVRSHYNLMLYTGASVQNGSKAAMMIDSRVDGLVLVLPPADSPIFLKCESRDIPYVSILREPVPGTLTVNADDFRGGHLATSHLIGLGHRRIAHLAGTDDVVTSAPRREGYRAALAEHGVRADESLILQAGFDWRHGYAAMKELLAKPAALRPTAIFAANDLCAEGAMRAIREAGASIPEDFAIVGYDDTFFATLTQPALTSVRMPIEELGQLAVRLLVNRVERKPIADSHPVLPVSLTVRASCGAACAEPTHAYAITEDINA
ncbi:MAG TPA: LacI family DNA-binding transcriptional regulator [Fimbriimonadaceae bacterium]|nr:LacI family DNA-binding transcriptional regulator [Fimbriimonadaceae bacterium]